MAKCKKCGSGGLFSKVNRDGLCLSCLEKAANQKITELETMLTPELRDAANLKIIISQRNQEAINLSNLIAAQKREERELFMEIEKLKRQRIVEEEAIELESFSLYTPKYEFALSQEYKEKLDACREEQKAMIKSKAAATCSTTWRVNNSEAQGRRMVDEMSKLFIRSFNNECDMAVSAVKFSNYERCLARMEKSFEAINKLGKTNEISLSTRYLQLKKVELHLAYQYQRKLQEEKEAARALREQQREEAKVAKEIEAARKEAEKERKHYVQALEKLKAQAQACTDDASRAAIVEKQNEIIGNLDELSKKLEDIDYRQSNQRAGYVYVISNIGSFGPDVYKIGMTRRLDPMERVFELGDASVPFMFDVHAMIFTDDAPKLEAALHQAFHDKRINMVNNRREYFRVSLNEIKKVVMENHDKTVEFKDAPDAQQYRESLLMRQSLH